MKDVVVWLGRLGRADSPLPVLALGAILMFAFQLDRTIHDVDIFWQVRLGELTLAHGLPSHEPFLAGKEQTPLAPVAWLGQVLYAAVRMLGGWPLLRFVDAAIWFAGFYVVAAQSARRLDNDWPALAGLFVGWFAAVPHASLRPQSLAVLCFGLLIVLVRCQIGARSKLILGTLLLIVWQNLHPSVFIGVAYLSVFAAVGWWNAMRFKASRPLVESLLLLASLAATVLTPAGARIFAIGKYNEEISKAREITEWLPMWGGSWFGWQDYGRENSWIALGLMGIVVLIAAVRFIVTRSWRIGVADLIVLLGLTAASLFMHRFSLFWGVASIPVVADALQIPTERTPRSRFRWPLALLAILFVIVPLSIARPTAFADYCPFAATNALKASPFRGVIYCNYFWGGILAEAGHPDWKVTHDGRYYLFTRDEWKRYDDAVAGHVPLDELLRLHNPDAFFLRVGHDDALIAQLRGRWHVLYEDKQAIIFVRNGRRIR